MSKKLFLKMSIALLLVVFMLPLCTVITRAEELPVLTYEEEKYEQGYRYILCNDTNADTQDEFISLLPDSIEIPVTVKSLEGEPATEVYTDSTKEISDVEWVYKDEAGVEKPVTSLSAAGSYIFKTTIVLDAAEYINPGSYEITYEIILVDELSVIPVNNTYSKLTYNSNIISLYEKATLEESFSSTPTYTVDISTLNYIKISGNNSANTIYFDIDTLPANIEEVIINGNGGEDTVTTSLVAGSQMNLSNIDMTINADNVIFSSNSNLTGESIATSIENIIGGTQTTEITTKTTLRFKSLTIKAKPVADILDALADYFTSQTYTVAFTDINLVVADDVLIEAADEYINEIEDQDTTTGTLNEFGSSIKNKASSLIEDTGVIANVKVVTAQILIDNADIKADSFSANTNINVTMSTSSVKIPLAVNVANLNSNVIVSGTSKINALSGDIKLQAQTTLNAKATASAGIVEASIGIAVINSDVNSMVLNDVILEALGAIYVTSNNDVKNTNVAKGRAANTDQKGIFVAVSVIDVNTLAQIKDRAKVIAGSNASIANDNLHVLSTQHLIDTTTSQTGPTTSLGATSTQSGFTFDNILTVLKNMLVQDGKGKVTALVNDKVVNSIKAKFNKSAATSQNQANSSTSNSTDNEEDEDSMFGNLFESSTATITIKYVELGLIKKAYEGVTVYLKVYDENDSKNVNAPSTVSLKTDASGQVVFKDLACDGTADSKYEIWLNFLTAPKYEEMVGENKYDFNVAPIVFTLTSEADAYKTDIIIKSQSSVEKSKTAKGSKCASTTQLVGVVSVVVINATNAAKITSSGLISITGKINIKADAVANSTLLSDASALATPKATPGLITYKVYDKKNNPVKNAKVTLIGTLSTTGGSSVAGQATTTTKYCMTNADGAAVFTDKDGVLNNGTYTYTVQVTEVPTQYIAQTTKTDVVFNETSKTYSGQGTVEFAATNTAQTSQQSSTFGLGVAVGVGVLDYDNEAYIGTNTNISAAGISIIANTGDYNNDATSETYDNKLSITAYAGYNRGDFGIGGAFAVNVANQKTLAYIADGATITSIISGGNVDINIEATEKTDTESKAKATQTGTIEVNTGTGATGTGTAGATNNSDSDSVGVGCGISVAVMENEVKAYIGSVLLPKLKDVSINASSSGTTTTVSNAGSSGGKSIVPVLSIDVVNNNVLATLFSNDSKIIAVGSILVSANSKKSRTVTADAQAAGISVAVGGAFNVGVANYYTQATIDRKIDGAININVLAKANNSSTSNATAGANGAAPKKNTTGTGASAAGTETTESTGNASDSESEVDKTVNNSLKNVSGMAGSSAKAAIPSTTPVKASTTEGSVNVAAAVVVDILYNNVVSSIKKDITATGDLSVKTLTNTTTSIKANGAATKSKTGVGVAVAIDVININAKAYIATNTTISAKSVEVITTNIDIIDDETTQEDETKEGKNSIRATATAGAGASNVGVAGAVVLTVINVNADAFINSIKLTTTNGDALIIADLKQEVVLDSGAEASKEAGSSQTSGTPSDTTGSSSSAGVGVGAAFALNIEETNVLAYLNDEIVATIEGNIEIKAIIDNDSIIKAVSGEDARSESTTSTTIGANTGSGVTGSTSTTGSDTVGDFKTALDAAVAIGLLTSQVKASVNEDANINAKALTLLAKSISNSNTTAEGSAEASTAAVGACVTVNIMYEDIAAILNGKSTIEGDVTVEAQANTTDISDAYATASGLDLSRYENRFNTTIAKILAGDFSSTNGASGTSGTGTSTNTDTNTGTGTGNKANIDSSQKAQAAQPKASESDGESLYKDLFNNEEGTNNKYKGDTNEKVFNNLFEEGNKYDKGNSVSSNVLKSQNVETKEVTNNTTGVVDAKKVSSADNNNTSKSNVNVNSVNTSNITTNNQTQSGQKISVAAAVGTNIVSHDTTAAIRGIVITGGIVNVNAINNNDFETLGTGAAVSVQTSIAVGVAVIVNNSTAIASVTGTVTATGANKDVTVKAETNNNVSDNFKDKLSAQAIAGAATGSGGSFGAAGAVAVLVSNSSTQAIIGDLSTLSALGDIKVKTVELSKLAARAWAATVSSTLINQASATNSGTVTNTSTQGGTGVGAAFAIITSKNEILSKIGKDCTITGKNVEVIATKQKVTTDNAGINIEINGKITIGQTVKVNDAKQGANTSINNAQKVPVNYTFYVNTTDNPQSEELIATIDTLATKVTDLAMDLLNLLASKNYYVEAVGGAGGANNKLSGAGSFGIIYFQNTVNALIGEGTDIILTSTDSNVDVKATSDISTIAITGAVAASGQTSIGVSAVALVNNDDTTAQIGSDVENTEKVTIISAKNVNVISDALKDFIVITVAGSGSSGSQGTGVAADGSVVVVVSDNDTLALVYNTQIDGATNVNVKANNNIKLIAGIGGVVIATGANSNAVGASFLINIMIQRTKAIIANNSIIGSAVKKAGNITVEATSIENVIGVVVNGSGSTGVAVSASPAVNVISSKTLSNINDSTINALTVTNNADSLTKLIVIAGGAAISVGGTVGVGASVAVAVLGKEIFASINNSIMNISTSTTVKALSHEQLISAVLGLSAGGSTAAVGGSINVDVINNSTDAHIVAEGVLGNVLITAEDKIDSVTVSGAFGISFGSVGVGFANTDLIINGNTNAYIRAISSKKLTTNTTDIKANNIENIYSFVVSASTASTAAINASINVVVINQKTIAYAAGEINTGKLLIEALNNAYVLDVVGNVSASGSAAVGASVDTITYNKTVKAYIEDSSKIISSDNVEILVNNKDDYTSVVVGGGGAGTVSVNGSVAVITFKDINEAYVGIDAILTGTKNVVVAATSDADIIVVTGNASIGGTAGIGASINTIVFLAKTIAQIKDGAKVNSLNSNEAYTFEDGVQYKGILIGAFSDQNIQSYVVSGAIGGAVSVGGSVNVLVLKEETKAVIENNTEIISSKDFVLEAKDNSKIINVVGSISASGTVSVGVSTDTVSFNKTVSALIGNNVKVKAIDGNMYILADADEDIASYVVGVGASGTVAVNGSVSTIVYENKVTSTVAAMEALENEPEEDKYTYLYSKGSIVICATDDEQISTNAGAISIGAGAAGVSAGVSVLTMNNVVTSGVGSFADIIVYGLTGVSFYTGTTSLVNQKKTKNSAIAKGLLIGAFNEANVAQLVASGAAGLYAGVGAASATYVNNSETNAIINSNSRVNQGNREYTSSPVVNVIALDVTNTDDAEVGVGGGAAGISAGVIVISDNKKVNAIIDSEATIYTEADIIVKAFTDNNILIAGAGAGIGGVGVAGTVIVYVAKFNVKALAGGNLKTKANLSITANSIIDILCAGGVVTAGSTGVGATSVTVYFEGTTYAAILEDAIVNIAGNVNVLADSKEDINLDCVGFSAGGVAITGSFAVLIAKLKTQAIINNNVVIESTGILKVTATDTPTIGMSTGSVSVGMTSAGGALNLLLFRNTVTAGINTNSRVTANEILVKAISDRTIEAYAISGAAGANFVSVAGSVIILLVGATPDTDINDSLKTKDGNGNESVSSAQTIDSIINSAFATSNVNVGDNGNEYIDKANQTTGSLALSVVDILGCDEENAKDKTSAYINGEETTSTEGAIEVIADENTELKSISGGLAANKVGIGGSAAIAVFKSNVEAYTSGIITAKTRLDIKASSDINTNTNNSLNKNILSNSSLTNSNCGFVSIGGAAGQIGIGAAVAWLDITGTVKACVNEGSTVKANDVNIVATLSMKGDVNALGLAAGIGAVGATLARVKQTANVLAYNAALKLIANNVIIKAYSIVNSNIKALAGAAGSTGAAAAAVSILTITPMVEAYSQGIIEANGDVLINAILSLSSTADSVGVSIAGAGSVGASITTMTVTPTINAYSTNSISTLGAIKIASLFNVNEEAEHLTGNKLDASSIAGAGSLVLAGAGAFTTVDNDMKINSYINGGEYRAHSLIVNALSFIDIYADTKGISVAGAVSVGASVTKVTQEGESKAYIANANVLKASDNKLADVGILNVHNDIIRAYAYGTAAALAATVTGQSVSIVDKFKVEAYTLTSEINSNTMLIEADNIADIYGETKGSNISVALSGGASLLDIKVDKETNARNGASITAKELVTIIANEEATVKGYAYASAAALAAGVGATVNISIINATTIELSADSSIEVTAGEIIIKATSDNNTAGKATQKSGGLVAGGVSINNITINDNVITNIGNNASVKALECVYIESYAVDKINDLDAVGGTGGVVSGAGVKAQGDIIANSKVNLGNNVVIKATGERVDIIAHLNAYDMVNGEIDFSAGGITILDVDAKATLVLDTEINLGNNANIEGNEVNIESQIDKIDAFVKTRSETVAVLNTQTRPTSDLTINGNAKILGANPVLMASKKLSIYAFVENVSARTSSYGYTAGVTGSVISKCINNTDVTGSIAIIGDNSEYHGKDIEIIASSPSSNQVTYVKDSTYKANTATEFVKKTVYKIVEVVEEVTEKVCKWLPWPLNKIVKWVVKTVTKLVRVAVDILVEVVLQSECSNVNEGNYSYKNNVTLYGKVYYGNTAPVTITIKENGTIDNATKPDGLIYSSTADSITIDFSQAGTGSLLIKSYAGDTNGNLTVYNNSMLSKVTIVNLSSKNLVIHNVMLSSNDEDNGNYRIEASNNQMIITDDTSITEPTIVNLQGTGNTNLTFDGIIAGHSAILNVINFKNVSTGNNARLEFNQININNSIQSIGTAANPFVISAFITVSGIDVNGNSIYKQPVIKLSATNDINASIAVKQLYDSADDIIGLTKLSGVIISEIIAGGNVNIDLLGGYAVTAKTVTVNIKEDYEYTNYNTTNSVINNLYMLYDTSALAVKYVIINDDITDYVYNNEAYTISYDEENAQYILTNNETLDTSIIDDEIMMIFDRETQQYRYINKVDYTEYTFEKLGADGEQRGIQYIDGLYYLSEVTEETVHFDYYTTQVTRHTEPVDMSTLDGSYVLEQDGDEYVLTHYIEVQLTSDDESMYITTAFDYGDFFVNNITAKNISIIGSASNIIVDGLINATDLFGKISIVLAGFVTAADCQLLTKKEYSTNDVKAYQIDLSAAHIGELERAFIVSAGLGLINVNATQVTDSTVYLYNYESDMNLGTINAGLGYLYIESEYGLVNGLADANANLTAKEMEIELADGKGFGTEDKYIICNTGTKGITIAGKANMYIKAITRDLYIKSINTNTSVFINASNNIYGIGDQEVLTANSITIMCASSIASKLEPLYIALGTGSLKVIVANNSYIKDTAGEVRISSYVSQGTGSIYLEANGSITANSIYSNGSIYISTQGNIFNGTDEPVLAGGNIKIVANELGSASKSTYLDLGDLKEINITTQGSIYLEANNLDKGKITAVAGDIVITADSIGYIDELDNSVNYVEINTAQDYTIDVYTSELMALFANTYNMKVTRLLSDNDDIYLKALDTIRINIITAENIYINALAGNIVNANSDVMSSNFVSKKLDLIAVNGMAGSEDKQLVLQITDTLSANIAQDAYIRQYTDDLYLGKLVVNGENLVITNNKSIYSSLNLDDIANLNANITAKNVTITSIDGQIGKDTNANMGYTSEDFLGWITFDADTDYEVKGIAYLDVYLRDIVDSIRISTVYSTNGDVNVSAYKDVIAYNDQDDALNIQAKNVYVETTHGTISVSVKATGDVIFNSCGSVSNIKQDGVAEIEVDGNNITIISKEGHIGEADSFIQVDTANNGILYLEAYEGIYVKELSGNLIIGGVVSYTGDIHIIAENGDIIGQLKNEQFDIHGNNVTVEAGGSIGIETAKVYVDATGNIKLISGKDIYIEEIKNEVNINTIEAAGIVNIVSAKGFTNAIDTLTDTNITADSIKMIALDGSFGTKESPIRIDIAKAVKLKASENIFVDTGSVDVPVMYIEAANTVELKTESKILNANTNNSITNNIKAKNIILNASDIGTNDKALVLELLNDGEVSIDALNDCNIYSTKSIKYSGMKVTNKLTLTTLQNLIKADIASIEAKEIILNANGLIGTKNSPIDISNNCEIKLTVNNTSEAYIDVKAVNLLNNVNNSDKVTITVAKLNTADETVNTNSGSATINKIDVKDSYVLIADNAIAAKETDNYNIQANTISLTSKNAVIGTKQNPICISQKGKGFVTLNAKESIYLQAISNIDINKLKASEDVVINSKNDILSTTHNNVVIESNNLVINANNVGQSNARINTKIANSVNIAAKSIYYTQVEDNIANGVFSADIIDIEAKNGSIGNKLNPVAIIINNKGYVNATAMNDINLRSERNIILKKIDAGNTIIINTDNAITSMDSEYNIKARLVELKADSVGSANRLLDIYLINDGSISIEANKGVYITSSISDLKLKKIKANSLTIITNESLTNVASNESVVDVKVLYIEANRVGTLANRFIIDTYDGMSTNIKAVDSIFIKEEAGIMNAELLSAGIINILAKAGMGTANKNINIAADNINIESTDVYANLVKDVNVLNIEAANIILITKSVETGSITGNLLKLVTDGSFGLSNTYIGTNINSIEYTGKMIAISNDKDLNLNSINAGTVLIKAKNIVSNKNSLLSIGKIALDATGTIGTKDNAIIISADSAQLTAGNDIYLVNNKSLILEAKAANEINVNVAGKLTANKLTAEKFRFTVADITANTVVKHLEGVATGIINITNTGALIIGGVNNDVEGIYSTGTITITAKSPVYINEDVYSKADIEINAGNTIGDTDVIEIAENISIMAENGKVELNAGDDITLAKESSIKANEVYIITGVNNTSYNSVITIDGNIEANNTNIRGAAIINLALKKSMGILNVSLKDCEFNINVDETDNTIDTYFDRIEINEQKIIIAGNGVTIVNAKNGSNTTTFYDTPCEMNINTGSGNDVFLIGRIIADNITSIDADETVEGRLTPGCKYALSINAGSGDNEFVVYSAKAPATLGGTKGYNNYTFKAFAMYEDDSTTPYIESEVTISDNANSNNITFIKSGLFDPNDLIDGTFTSSTWTINGVLGHVEVKNFEPADGATKEYATGTFVWYSIKQLLRKPIFYIVLILGITIIVLLLVIKKKRIKKYKLPKINEE